MNNNDFSALPILILLFLVWVAWRYWKTRESPVQRRKRLAEEARQRTEVDEQRQVLLDKPIPPEVQEFMDEYLISGSFTGEESSPLAYVGYRVGKTRGLGVWDRQRRLMLCFRMELPRELPAKYCDWGRPATLRRYNCICGHLEMLADMRRNRAGFEYAVADWDRDHAWFRTEFGDMARRFGKFGYYS